MGYSGTHGTEDIKRQKMLSKPKYFQKNFEKSSSARSEIPHLNTKATPEELEHLRQKLKKEKLKRTITYIITLFISIAILYLLWQQIS